MRLISFIPLVAAALAGASPRCRAAPELAPLFRDHAVLQQGMPVPVWGTAAPGEHVSVTFGGRTVGATAGADGRWVALLSPLAADSSGADLTVAGRAVEAIHDVVVGEVWLCSGESGMEFAVDAGPARRVEDADAEVAAARYPLIRQFKVARQASPGPVDAAAGDWRTCSPDTVRSFSAIGYFFARNLFHRLQVPVGIINSSRAGTQIESWMSPAALAAFPRASGGSPASLFNGMIRPLLPYAIRGVLWYQGESDVNRDGDYSLRFPALIAAWRAHLGEGDLPFFWVQLGGAPPSYRGPGEPWAALREAQSKALSLPMTGEAVALDIGTGGRGPGNLREIGRRLAQIAKAKVYEIPVDYSGPVFAGLAVEGPSVRVRFAFAGEGLTASGGPLRSFEVAGADRVFHPAGAVIQGGSVIVRSAAVGQPVAVRYAWGSAPDANLYNGAGLPAAPFRSDAW